jgi:hypothetical protein
MTDQEIENLYWGTASQYSAMANHAAVIVAFARRIEKAAIEAAAKPGRPLEWPVIDPIPSTTAADRLGMEPFELTGRS